MAIRSDRRKTLRLNGYDYSQTGAYFITICAQDRKSLFGSILNDEMHLNEPGRIIDSCWRDLPSHYPTIELDYFTVMPNHIHGIIFLVGAGSPRPGVPSRVVGGETPPLQKNPSLSTIIGYFKYQSTQQLNGSRQTLGAKVWQRGFYDHIIRDDDSLNRIRAYIETNAWRWQFDRENPEASARDDFDVWLDSLKTSHQKKNPFSQALMEEI